MSSVLDRAQNFSGGPVAAARQRDRWARQEANATDDEKREQFREAIADLEARYPDLHEVPVGGAEKFARERGHGSGARSPVHEGRRRSGSRGPARTAKAKSPSGAKASTKASRGSGIPGLDPTARRSPSSRKVAKGSPTPKVDRAIRQTGIPAAVSSGGSTVMATLGATVGLSLLYLLVSSAEKPGSGAAALPTMIGSVTRALGRFLSLDDIFPPATAHVGVVPGTQPLKPRASSAELNRVERQAVRRGGRRGIPGEVGSSGIDAGALANPSTELAGPNTAPLPGVHIRPRRRRRRTRR